MKINPKMKSYLILGIVLLLVAGAFILPNIQTNAQKESDKASNNSQQPGVYTPVPYRVEVFPPVNVAEAAQRESLNPPENAPWLDVIPAPKGTPPIKNSTVEIVIPDEETNKTTSNPSAIPPSATGSSPGPTKTFQGEFLSGTNIPPDTMGAVGVNHVVNVTNNQMRITDRNGVQLQRMTLNAFWAGTTIKGTAVTSTFDPKVLYDRFNDRFMMISSAGAQSVNSGALFAVTLTGDPTGTWYRITTEADPTSTASGGLWIDYPSIGINKNWIVINYNTFGYGTVFGYQRADIFVLDKQAFYANTLTTVNKIQDSTANCVAPFIDKLGCGFTINPAIVEDNTTENMYLVEDWDSTAGQLRILNLTGTAAAPVLTVGTQFPQSTNSWRFNASRIASSGGYAPQKQQSAFLPSATRIMTNDSRLQNAVMRNGSLWTAHTVMLAATPTAAGVAVGGTANPDIRSAIQWWQINPTIVNSATGTPPLQRARIEDPTADNCHNGSAGTRTVATCNSTALQVGQFLAFPNISVNKDNDVLIGFTQFSAYTYPSGAYAVRRSTDPVNTMRDPVVFRPGQSNYNIGSGSGTARQNRWGDYSAAQTDPLNDTDFWTVQEYSGTYRDFGFGLAAPWETWWAQVSPATAAPSRTGNLIISEFRLRGPQGVRDEFVELYNPGATPVIVNTTDNSDGWSLAYSSNGTTVTGVAVIPNGTVIPVRGHFLIANNPDGAVGPTAVYSLNTYPSVPNVRGATSDTGYSIDLADNGGVAIFKTATIANFTAVNRMDSVGFAAVTAGLFKEGAGIPNITAATPTGQISFVRNLSSGQPQDTDMNQNDFIFVNTNAVTESLGSTPTLGAPGTQNLDSPIQRNAQLPVNLIDSTVAADAAPNQVQDATPVTNGANGTVSIRRNVVNNTGELVTRLRFRITTLPTFPNLTPDVRLLSSPQLTGVQSNDPAVCGSNPVPCSLTVESVVLETPPAQPNGGGINSSGSAAVVTFANPIPVNGKINVNFLFGIQAGTLRPSFAPQAPLAFNINTEVLTRMPVAPTAASVTVSGRVVSSNGRGIANAVITMTDSAGEVHSARTNSFGYYKLEDIEVGESYIFSVKARRYHFASQVVQVIDELVNLDFTASED